MPGHEQQPEQAPLLGDEGVALCHALGMPAHMINNSTMLDGIYPSLVHAFTNGDIDASFPEGALRDPEKVMWFGETVSEGLFCQRLAAIGDQPITEPLAAPFSKPNMDQLQRTVATLFAWNLIEKTGLGFREDRPALPPPLATIEGNEVIFSGPEVVNGPCLEHRGQLDQPVKSVIDINPGVRSAHLLDRLVDALRLRDTKRILTYYPFNDQHFASAFTQAYVKARFHALHVAESPHASEEQWKVNWQFLQENMLSRFLVSLVGDTSAMVADLARRPQNMGRIDLLLHTQPTFIPDEAAAEQRLQDYTTLIKPGGGLLIARPIGGSDREGVNGIDFIRMAAAGRWWDHSRTIMTSLDLENLHGRVFAFFVKKERPDPAYFPLWS